MRFEFQDNFMGNKGGLHLLWAMHFNNKIEQLNIKGDGCPGREIMKAIDNHLLGN